MQRLLAGVLNFRRHTFQTKRDLFSRLATTQNPQELFITCSDPRIFPSLITQNSPGDLFVVRNAGNIVPSWPHGGGETASIEYAVEVLKVRDIVVCGHTRNIAWGLIGAIPLTGVIVRSAANISSGAKTRLSTILHGLLLLIFVACLPTGLNLIPVAVLAGVLIYYGLKLINPSAVRSLAVGGRSQLVIFACTGVAILATDLLRGF